MRNYIFTFIKKEDKIMSRKNEVIDEEIKEEVIDEECEVIEEDCETSKFEWIKAHGKKIAIGAGLVAVGVIGYALTRRSNSSDEYISNVTNVDNLTDLVEDVVDPE